MAMLPSPRKLPRKLVQRRGTGDLTVRRMRASSRASISDSSRCWARRALEPPTPRGLRRDCDGRTAVRVVTRNVTSRLSAFRKPHARVRRIQ